MVDGRCHHITGYLGSYKSEWYHLLDFRGESQPRGKTKKYLIMPALPWYAQLLAVPGI